RAALLAATPPFAARLAPLSSPRAAPAARSPPLQPARRPCSPLAALAACSPSLRPARRPCGPLTAHVRPARRPCSPLAALVARSPPLQPARRPCSPLAAPAARSPPLRPARRPCGPLAAPAAHSPLACGPLAAPCSQRAAPCSPLDAPSGPLAAPCSPRTALWQPARCPSAARLPPPPCRPAAARPATCATRLLPALLLAALAVHRPVLLCFDTWLDDLQLYLLSDYRDSVSLFDHTSGASLAPPADSVTRSQWLTHDAAACLAIRNHLPLVKCAHFGQHKTAKALYDAVVACYSSPTTAALGRLIPPYLFPVLSVFAIVEDLVTQFRTSDARYRAALPAEFFDRNPPSMYITLYFTVNRLPDSLGAVRDHFNALDPTDLTVDLLEQHLLAAETSAVAVGAAHGTPRTPFFEGCSPPPLLPPTPLLLLLTSLVLRMSGLLLLLVGSAAAARARVAGAVAVAAGVVVGAAVEVVEVVEVVAAVGVVMGVGALVAAVGVAVVAAVGVVAVGVELFRGKVLAVANDSSSSVGARPLLPRGFTCGKLHSQHRCFSRLDVAWRAELGDEAERPRWAELLKSGVDIFALDYDAILAAMYTLSVSAEGDCYLCVPPDPGIEAAALGVSASALPGTAPAEALHTFTLDSGASRCFFRESTTLTPLPTPVPVKLADPSGGPVLACSSTVLLCPAVLSGSLSGLHLPSFFTNLVSITALQDAMVTTTTPGGHSSSFPPTAAPLQTLQIDSVSSSASGSASSRLHSDKGERRIGLVMEVARTSMIHAAAPHFLWPFAVRYAAHQLNLWPRVSLPETSPTQRWTGKVGDASVFRVWGSRAFVRDTSADKLSARAIPCVFLGLPPDAPGWQFYHPTSCRVLPSQDITFDESVPLYRLFPYRSAPLPPPQLFLAPGPPPVDPLPPQGPSPAGVSQVDPLPGTVHVEVAVDSGAARGTASGGVTFGGAELACAELGGAEPAGAEPGGAEPEGAEPASAEYEGAESGGAEPKGTASSGGPAGASPRLSPRPEPLSLQQLREWFAHRTRLRSGAAGAGGSAAGGTGAGGAGATSLGGAGVPTRAGGTGGAGAAGPGGAHTRGTGAAGAGGVGGAGARDPGAGGTGAGGTSARGAGAGGAGVVDPGAGGAGTRGSASNGTGAGGTVQRCPFFPDSPLPAPSPYAEQTDSLTERREPGSRPASPVRTGRQVPRLRPPPVRGTHVMAFRPSSAPLRGPLLPPPASSLPAVPNPKSDLARAASPTISRLLATIVTDPSFESTAASALVAELVDFAAACRLHYTTSLVAESESDCPPSVGGECALCTHVLEDKQDDFECLSAAVPHLVAMLLAPEGDPDAPDIPTPRSYAEAITVPPYGANIVDGMWIFRVKQPPGSPPVFKARYVAQGFSQQQGVDFFQTFSPTPKMTSLRDLLHVAAQRDYEIHPLYFSTAFLQGSLQEEI
ncbi:unnamed protein product, partial [Closterium sp. NIES-54]